MRCSDFSAPEHKVLRCSTVEPCEPWLGGCGRTMTVPESLIPAKARRLRPKAGERSRPSDPPTSQVGNESTSSRRKPLSFPGASTQAFHAPAEMSPASRPAIVGDTSCSRLLASRLRAVSAPTSRLARSDPRGGGHAHSSGPGAFWKPTIPVMQIGHGEAQCARPPRRYQGSTSLQ